MVLFLYDSNKMFQIKKFQIKCGTVSVSRLKDEFIKFQIKAVNSLQMLCCGTTPSPAPQHDHRRTCNDEVT